MGDNYLTRQQKKEEAIAKVAFDSGFQAACDLLVLVLRDPDVVYGDIHGFTRLDRIYKGLQKYEAIYHDAWTTNRDADYLQDKLDANIRGVAKDHFEPFMKRHPYVNQATYNKSKKGWR